MAKFTVGSPEPPQSVVGATGLQSNIFCLAPSRTAALLGLLPRSIMYAGWNIAACASAGEPPGNMAFTVAAGSSVGNRSAM